jgi:hypothetical protein
MAHRTKLNSLIADLTGISKHTIDRIGVNLNKGGLILALLGSDRTSRVFQTVLNLHTLKSKNGELFGDVVLDICSDQVKANEIMQVSVLRNFPQATIYWKDESGSRVGRMQDFRTASEDQPRLRVVASLQGSVINELVKFMQGAQLAVKEESLSDFP